jgi:hypothetical protein
MKYLGFLLIVATVFTACLKTNEKSTPDRVITTLSFSYVHSPDTAKLGDTVITQIKVNGPNLCYKFEGFSGANSGPNQYDINAVGSYPNPEKSDTICPTFPYTKDTSLTIIPNVKGKMILRFFNSQTLFQADTIVIN